MADNFVKGIVYETNYWIEESTGKAFTKCLKCGALEYLDENHTKCTQCGATIKPHRVCKACGNYKGKKVTTNKEETKSEK